MSTRQAAIQRVLYVTLGLNLAVATAKLVVGSMSGSVALWADGLHSMLDGSSNVVALVGIWFAHRPPDDSRKTPRRVKTRTCHRFVCGISRAEPSCDRMRAFGEFSCTRFVLRVGLCWPGC